MENSRIIGESEAVENMWFNRGRINASVLPSQEDIARQYVYTSPVMSQEAKVCFVMGAAYQIVEDYHKMAYQHAWKIESTFFWTYFERNQRKEEAKHLNALGFAEEALFRSGCFFLDNIVFETENAILSREYLNNSQKAIYDTLKKIKSPTTEGYVKIKENVEHTKDKIKEIVRLLRKSYLGFDPYSENGNAVLSVYAPDFGLGKKVNFKLLLKESNRETDGEKAFPYASKFLSNFVIDNYCIF